ncbi:hypothetical protein FOBRF1_005077 [Fusarium oxysporum]
MYSTVRVLEATKKEGKTVAADSSLIRRSDIIVLNSLFRHQYRLSHHITTSCYNLGSFHVSTFTNIIIQVPIT